MKARFYNSIWRHSIKQTIHGVIFDLDGTLVTSSLNFAEIRATIGCPPDEDILRFMAKLDPAARCVAEQQVIDFEMQDARQAAVLPGVPEMLSQLRHWQVPTAIVTRNCVKASRLKLQLCGLEFDILLTRECAPGKPDPTALLEVAARWQIRPDNIIYVGDYLHDINAAKNARMRSVLMSFKAFPEWGKLATWQFSDYEDLVYLIAKYRETEKPATLNDCDIA